MAVIFDREEAETAFLAAQKGNLKAKEKCGIYIMAMYNAMKSKPNWKGYIGHAEEMMRGEALLRMTQAIYTWNPKKSTVYSYLQMICSNAFSTKVVQFNRRHQHEKALNESYLDNTRQLEKENNYE
jgi:hypothetical protein